MASWINCTTSPLFDHMQQTLLQITRTRTMGSRNRILKEKPMTTKTTSLIHKSTMCILRLGLLSTLGAAGPLLAQAAPPNLVQIVREATEKFTNVNAATAAGYAP